ncbi:hypothetical protein K438DRAFT_490445 [Mycena galopus ATCC 62051]|nr:hypothetical protein K438DRAFT_490445 [Mycena galopus ATCC 62051]
MSTPTPTSDPHFIAALLQSINAVKYSCVAGIAWITYDILINLGREVKHFWSGKWSFPRVLYFLNRYFSLARLAFFVSAIFRPISTITVCTAATYMQTWTGAFEIWFLQIILIYRINSLYRTKKILISTVAFFLCSAAGVMTIITISINTSKGWLIRNIGRVRKNALLFQSNSHLIELILRDSMWYFLVACLVDITSLVIWQAPLVPAGTMWTTGFATPTFSIIGTRLLLNLREYGDVMEYISTGLTPAPDYRGTEPHSAIEFAEQARTTKTTCDDSSTGIHTGLTPAPDYRGTEPHSAIEFAEQARTTKTTCDDSSTGIHTTILHVYPETEDC